MVVFIFI